MMGAFKGALMNKVQNAYLKHAFAQLLRDDRGLKQQAFVQ